MVCLTGKPGQDQNSLNVGVKAAHELDAELLAVFVDTRIWTTTTDLRALWGSATLASSLGARLVFLRSRHTAPALLNFARMNQVARIVISRAFTPIGRFSFRQRLVRRLVDGARGFQIQLTGLGPSDRPSNRVTMHARLPKL
jgi:K+-sensing histidine kinase KdpD